VLVGARNGPINDAYGGVTNEVFYKSRTDAERNAGLVNYGHAGATTYWYKNMVTGTPYDLGIGHLDQSNQTGKQAGELWADFFSAQMTQDTETLSKMKVHFPTAYEAMEQMAVEMAKT